jgi:hypothetical protein
VALAQLAAIPEQRPIDCFSTLMIMFFFELSVVSSSSAQRMKLSRSAGRTLFCELAALLLTPLERPTYPQNISSQGRFDLASRIMISALQRIVRADTA